MQKLEINFDVIDKTYEARGEHNIRRWLRLNKTYNISAILYPTMQGILAINGIETPDVALIKSGAFVVSAYGIWSLLDTAVELLRKKATGLDYKERALYELIILSKLIEEMGINISVEQMMKANVYKKKYKLAIDGRAGIIRERYFEVPFTDILNKERMTSVKEEHLLGSHKYVLCLDKPTEQKEYNPAYNM